MNELADQPTWKRLIHLFDSQARIKDPNFILSGLPLNARRELVATLRAFLDDSDLSEKHAICRFPARFRWLTHELQLPIDAFPKPHCAGYLEYLNKASADEISLVFASENVVSPSSMMGHTFLKISGKTPSGRIVEHAFTYFTVLNSINVPKLIYQNITGGMRGIFALQPYRRLQKTYLVEEERNLWEYSLRLTAEQRALIHAHLWELNGIESDYLFAAYNCATVTNHLLSLAEPSVGDRNLMWMTPIDVTKNAFRSNLVVRTVAHTSDRWKMQMLLERNADYEKVYSGLQQLTFENSDMLVNSLIPDEKLFALAYLRHERRNGQLAHVKNDLKSNLQEVLAEETSSYLLDYSDYRNPTRAPGNRQIGFAVGRDGEQYIGFKFLPASHRFTDDHRQFFSNSELLMLDFNVKIYEKQKAALESLTFYSAKAINSWSIFTPALSGQWGLRADKQMDDRLESHLILNLYGGLGLGFNATTDVSAFGLYNVGLATQLQEAFPFHYPEFGIQINEIFDSKTIISYIITNNSYNTGRSAHSLNACQSFYPSKDSTFLACYKKITVNDRAKEALELSYQYHF